MDFPTKHWAPFTRRHPSAFPVVNADHLPAKDHWMRTTFSTCNFSFILRGRGEFHRLGRRWAVEAPCVITQWPGEALEYGPTDAPRETWEEFYICYAAETRAHFEQARLLDPARPLWPILDLGAVRTRIEALSLLAQCPDPASVVDRMDRACENLILESWLPPLHREAPPGDASTVEKIARELRSRFAEPDLRPDAVARHHGWSSSTFRRRWSERHAESPARTLQGLRIRHACRLLVESALPIHEIATRSGFADEFYFSRRFHLEQGLSPRAYRRAYWLRRE